MGVLWSKTILTLHANPMKILKSCEIHQYDDSLIWNQKWKGSRLCWHKSKVDLQSSLSVYIYTDWHDVGLNVIFKPRMDLHYEGLKVFQQLRGLWTSSETADSRKSRCWTDELLFLKQMQLGVCKTGTITFLMVNANKIVCIYGLPVGKMSLHPTIYSWAVTLFILK